MFDTQRLAVVCLFTPVIFRTGINAIGIPLDPAGIRVAAVEPTAAGQIGVNLVDPISSPQELVGKVGKNTEYLTDLGGEITSWKGPDSSFITKTIVTVTNTAAGTIATTTKDASVSVSLDNDENISILLGPALREKLVEIAKTIPACGARKRSAACGYPAFAEAVAQYGPLREVAEIENAMPAGRFVIPANDIAQLVALFKAGASTIVSPASVAGGGTLGLLYLVYAQWHSSEKIPPVIDIPKHVVGTTATPNSTSQACPTATDMPSCPDQDCQGEKEGKCTVGEHKDCECVDDNREASEDVPTEWINLRSVVEQIVPNTDPRPVPECTDSKMVGFETKYWKEMVTNICASRSLYEDISSIQTSKDAGFSGYEGWSFAMSWRYEAGDCVFGCEEMFAGFLSSTACSYDSHTFAKSGINKQGCGTASFVINEPRAAEPAPPTESCIEKVLVDCKLEDKPRPDLTKANCPPIPELPAKCIRDRLPEYCHNEKPGTCTLATDYISVNLPKENTSRNGYIYDHTCRLVGAMPDIKAQSSMTSELPWTVEIMRYDTGGVVTDGGPSLSMRFAYAGRVKGKGATPDDRKYLEDCVQTDYSTPNNAVRHAVWRCPFDCSKPKA